MSVLAGQESFVPIASNTERIKIILLPLTSYDIVREGLNANIGQTTRQFAAPRIKGKMYWNAGFVQRLEILIENGRIDEKGEIPHRKKAIFGIDKPEVDDIERS